jgi:hypothetical protein
LGRALVGQLIKMDYLLKTTAESIGKEGSSLYSFRKSADFCLEEKSAGVVSGYEQKRLTDLVLPKVKMTDKDRNSKGIVFQG